MSSNAPTRGAREDRRSSARGQGLLAFQTRPRRRGEVYQDTLEAEPISNYSSPLRTLKTEEPIASDLCPPPGIPPGGGEEF